MKRILCMVGVIVLVALAIFLVLKPTNQTNEVVAVTAPPELTQLQEKVGQLLWVGFRGLSTEDNIELQNMLVSVQPGGVVLFDYDVPSGGIVKRNIESPEQLTQLTAELQAASDIPLIISVDAEGGYVNRLKEKYGFSVVVPPAQTLGTLPIASTTIIAGELAASLASYGVTTNLAPVVDVNVATDSPAIGWLERSFSEDPDLVVQYAQAYIDAHHEAGIMTALKHFPGHGSAGEDSHEGLTDITDTYEQARELRPYELLIGKGQYRDPVMTAHVIDRNTDDVPATLSSVFLTDILRSELGFTGVVVSDDMQMGAITENYGLTEAAVQSIQAGVDVVLIANQIGEYDLQSVIQVRDAIVKAVESGEISEERIDQSYDRVMELKQQYQLVE